ncbi:hypothetical protein RUM44_013868 [Polyplax serrata]|uniref:Uncharacterized protein n=1 Tax=Polyplax serrata TaxID=468196 RepID=A0ABR1BHJ0_POLSC
MEQSKPNFPQKSRFLTEGNTERMILELFEYRKEETFAFWLSKNVDFTSRRQQVKDDKDENFRPLDEKPQMLVDSTGIGPPPPPPPPTTSDKPDDPHESPETSQEEADDRKLEDDAKEETAEGATTGTNQDRRDEGFDKSPNRSTR